MEKTILPISIVIPTFNRAKTLNETLVSILNGNNLPKQIVIVDQSENDNTRELIANKPHNIDVQLTYIHLNKPSSTMARNAGLNKCSQEYIIFSDDDINIYHDTLQNVYKHISKNNIAMIAALDDCTKRHKSILSYIAGINSIRKRNIGSMSKSCFGSYPTIIDSATPTEWAMGYFFVVKQTLLRKWNIRWDEHLVSYAYNEDLDFSYSYYNKSIKEGLKCMIFPDVHVKHLCSKEYRIPDKKHIRMFVLHRYYIAHKHRLGFSALIMNTYANLFFLLRSCIKRNGMATEIFMSTILYFRNKHAIDNGNIEHFLE